MAVVTVHQMGCTYFEVVVEKLTAVAGLKLRHDELMYTFSCVARATVVIRPIDMKYR